MTTKKYSPVKLLRVAPYCWELLSDFTIPYMHITVPKGTTSDGASIPRIFWSFSDPTGDFFEAALVHDYLYSNALHTKEIADALFYMILLDFGVPKWKARIAHTFVKLFGRGAYAKNSR